MCSPAGWSRQDADEALRQLLQATLEKESLVAARDAEVNAVAVRYSAPLNCILSRIALHEKHLFEYYDGHRDEIEKTGAKRLELGYGWIGMRSPSNPALIPLSEKWTWDRIAKKLKSSFKNRFFHPPKPPQPDKVKLKKELSAEQLAKVGLKLDDTETFYVDLNRLNSQQAAPLKKAA